MYANRLQISVMSCWPEMARIGQRDGEKERERERESMAEGKETTLPHY